MHSNVTPFACRRGRKFRCIFDCCQDVEFSALRDHTRSKHATHLIHAVRGEPKTMLRVDITDLRCTICDHPIPDLELLESHLKDAHDLSTYKNTADVLVPYKLTEGVYRCQLCGEVSDNFPAIDTHMESHFPLNICEVCGRGFMSVSRLKTHSLEHAEKPFACETCQVTFVSESLKRRHVNYIHKGIGALICHMCPGLRFKDHKLKLDHMEQAHGREKRPTPTCSDCGKVFSYESSLTAHIKNIHQALKLNKCKLCDERFCIKKDLEKHVRLVHVAERLPCVYCDRSYTTVMELSKHMRKIHPDLERRCLCWDCGKPFENRLKLKQHRSNEHSSL